jgi:hypothetical protein
MMQRSRKWGEWWKDRESGNVLNGAWESAVNLAMSGKVGIKMMRCLAQ